VLPTRSDARIAPEPAPMPHGSPVVPARAHEATVPVASPDSLLNAPPAVPYVGGARGN
jgi:hypothetical protein